MASMGVREAIQCVRLQVGTGKRRTTESTVLARARMRGTDMRLASERTSGMPCRMPPVPPRRLRNGRKKKTESRVQLGGGGARDLGSAREGQAGSTAGQQHMRMTGKCP